MSNPRFFLKSLLLTASVLLPTAFANAEQGYTGTFATTRGDASVTLEAATGNQVSGTFTRGNDRFNVTLGPADDKMVGAASDASGVNYPLLVQLYEGTLYFKIYEADAQGNVISSSGVQYDMQRVSHQSAPGAQGDAGWAGSYENPWGNRLTLRRDGNSYSGTLTADGNSFPIALSTRGRELAGTFSSGGNRFPVRVRTGEEPEQIVLESDGTLIEMSRVASAAKPANPLAANKPINPLSGGSMSHSKPGVDLSGTFAHPDGYFSMNVPSSWSANMMSEDAFSLETGTPQSITLALMAELEPDEIGKPPREIMRSAHDMIDTMLAENFGMYANSQQAQVELIDVGGRDGVRSTRPAQSQNGNVTIWQGVVVEGKSAFVLMTVVPPGAPQLMGTLDAALRTVRLKRAWQISEFASASGRRVSFNGKMLSDQELAELEGGNPIIPDGAYWYDARSGMAGSIGGPTEAYLATGLSLGGNLSSDASGGGTRVAFNGRYLHPIDLAGLEMYFGQINPGRYWLDGEGNYGSENGPRLGNLVEEITAIQYMAAALQAQYQQQLNAAVAQYQGQGGGGYYDQGGGYQQGGGSVYSHFPNLGASGTGVSVANVGGGDTIVNAGGVMWWPGK